MITYKPLPIEETIIALKQDEKDQEAMQIVQGARNALRRSSGFDLLRAILRDIEIDNFNRLVKITENDANPSLIAARAAGSLATIQAIRDSIDPGRNEVATWANEAQDFEEL